MFRADVFVGALVALCTAGCAAAAPAPQTGPIPPSELRGVSAEMVVGPVEAGVSEIEVSAAINAMLADAPLCMAWPSLWLDPSERSFLFVARYDLMTRDWGGDVTAESRLRMEEFVAAGFLSRRSESSSGAVEYALTDQGRATMRGSPYTTQRPVFCAPAQRRLASITAMESGRFACGTLRVHFSHVADDWPSWAQQETMRARLETLPPGVEGRGAVTLARRWYNRSVLARGAVNGALASLCVADERVTGDDLNLFAAP